MESNFLNSIGLGQMDIGIVLFVILILVIIGLVLTVLNTLNIKKLGLKYYSFMKGRSGKSLEKEIFQMFDENRKMQETILQNKMDIRSLIRQMETTYQKMGLVKYDAYDQMGGQMSFCLTMLNENNDGFLLNSIQNMGSCYSYMKKIEEGKCSLDLSVEEKKALSIAINGTEDEIN